MTFIKGQSGNPSGRRPGSKNRIGAALRQRIESFLFEQFDIIAADFESMHPAERQKLFVSLLPYCIGKKQDLNIDTQLGQLSDTQLDIILSTIEQTDTDEDTQE
jgi:hypothetical protein